MRDIFSNLLKAPVQWVGNLARNLLSDVTGADPDSVGRGLADTFLGTTYGQQNLAAQQFGYNQQLAGEARSWQERMLAQDRAYNSPANQMALMREAGLNPNLAYGQMSDMSGSSPSPVSASVGLGSAPHGNLSLSDALLGAQIENINADTEQKKGQTKAIEIQNKIDTMNADAFTEFYNQNRNDIIRTMQQQLGIAHNDFVLSNFDTMQSAWDFSILFGISYSDALKSGSFIYQDSWDENLERFFDNLEDNPNYKKAKELFIGGYDAEIATNAAIKVVNDALRQKKQKDVEIWTFLNEKAKNGDKWEKIGAQVALAALFISEQNFSIPMPNLNFMNFKRNSSQTTNYNGTFNNSYQSHSRNAIYN